MTCLTNAIMTVVLMEALVSFSTAVNKSGRYNSHKPLETLMYLHRAKRAVSLTIGSGKVPN
jgi:hypothetical protein